MISSPNWGFFYCKKIINIFIQKIDSHLSYLIQREVTNKMKPTINLEKEETKNHLVTCKHYHDFFKKIKAKKEEDDLIWIYFNSNK